MIGADRSSTRVKGDSHGVAVETGGEVAAETGSEVEAETENGRVVVTDDEVGIEIAGLEAQTRNDTVKSCPHSHVNESSAKRALIGVIVLGAKRRPMTTTMRTATAAATRGIRCCSGAGPVCGEYSLDEACAAALSVVYRQGW